MEEFHPCHFGFNSAACKLLELFGNDSIALAQSLLRISTPCKAVLKRVSGKECFQNEQTCKTSAKS